MKTNSLILGAAVLMLATACSNDEVVKVAENSRAIGFSSFVNNSTRATDNTAANLNDLKVWGIALQPEATTPYNVFAGDLVSKSIANDELSEAWKYDVTRYWAVNNSYTFTAVAPASAILEAEAAATAAGAKVNPGSNMTKGAVASIAFTNDGTIDLLYDAQDVAASANAAAYGTVTFNLRHILSRVRFEFKNELADGYSIKVSALNITDANTKATFNGEEWTVDPATTGTVGFDFDGEEVADPKFVDKAAATASAKSQPSYIFPTSETTSYALTFKVELILEDALTSDPVSIETYTHTVALPETEYKLGYSYAFKTVINADNVDPVNPKKPIEFKATVEEWKDETDINPTDFNLK